MRGRSVPGCGPADLGRWPRIGPQGTQNTEKRTGKSAKGLEGPRDGGQAVPPFCGPSVPGASGGPGWQREVAAPGERRISKNHLPIAVGGHLGGYFGASADSRGRLPSIGLRRWIDSGAEVSIVSPPVAAVQGGSSCSDPLVRCLISGRWRTFDCAAGGGTRRKVRLRSFRRVSAAAIGNQVLVRIGSRSTAFLRWQPAEARGLFPRMWFAA